MDTLTRKQLIELAPGAASLEDSGRRDRDRLLDTTHWLEAALPAKPVFAMQGSGHSDGNAEPRYGRHLVVAARPDGVAYTLLNSHDRLMRVWAGVGLWNGRELLLAKVVPLRRWKWEEDWNAAEWPNVAEARDDMLVRSSVGPALAEAIAKYGYGPRGRPSSRALYDAAALIGLGPATRVSQLTEAFDLVAAARKGNLAPSTKSSVGILRRNVKGIRRPDAYQRLALAAYKAAMELSQ